MLWHYGTCKDRFVTTNITHMGMHATYIMSAAHVITCVHENVLRTKINVELSDELFPPRGKPSHHVKPRVGTELRVAKTVKLEAHACQHRSVQPKATLVRQRRSLRKQALTVTQTNH